MKRLSIWLVTVPLIVSLLALGACSDDDGATAPGGTDGPGGGDDPVVEFDGAVMFAAVKQAAPAFTAGTAKAEISDPALQVAFQLLREYTYPDDEGVVDMSNIYKVLWEASGYMENASRGADPIDATDASISPYAFSDFLGDDYSLGDAQEESDGYGRSTAHAVVGTEQRMLVTYKWAPQPTDQITIGVIQARYDTTTTEVSLRFAQTVQYPAGSPMGGAEGDGFAIRARIDGNATTHAFELQMAIGETSLVGKGISRGDSNHFLFRSGDQYYAIAAGASEDDLAAITPTTLAAVPDVCADYADAVSQATPYDLDTDLPALDLSDFDGGVAGTPVKYLMF